MSNIDNGTYINHQSDVQKQMRTIIRDETQLSFAICWRPIPARVGEEHIMTRLLRNRGYRAIQTQDTSLAFHAFDVVLILENCHWFPIIMDELVAMKKNTRRPLIVVWHWEPLPLPKGQRGCRARGSVSGRW